MSEEKKFATGDKVKVVNAGIDQEWMSPEELDDLIGRTGHITDEDTDLQPQCYQIKFDEPLTEFDTHWFVSPDQLEAA